MLNIKTTDFQKDKVWLSVRVDGGTLLATRDDPTRVALAGSLAVGGLQAHSFDDLRTIFAGKTVNPSFGTGVDAFGRSEEHTSELQSLMRISYAVFCLKKKNNTDNNVCILMTYT